jgi:hypothetical protein
MATPISHPIEACTHRPSKRSIVDLGTAFEMTPYSAELLQEGDKYENCPAGVAHPKVLELEVAIMEDLSLELVSPRKIWGKLDLCIVRVSKPCDESAKRQSNYDDDQQHNSKDSQRQVLPRPAPVAWPFEEMPVENAKVVEGGGETMTLAYRMNLV